MQPKIIDLEPLKFIGMRDRMNLKNNTTTALWQRFIPRRKEIQGRLNTDYYSINCYDPGFSMATFTPDTVFEKWAAVAVAPESRAPEGMEALAMPSGLYAVFLHKGPSDTFTQTLQHIYGTWMPTSGYRLDSRPHFEILQEGWSLDDPEGEEAVWVPIRKI